MIPQTTMPLTKFIRTGEGILVFAFNIALLVVPIVSNSLSPGQAAKWATIIDGIAVVSRTGLKMVSSMQVATGAPTTQASGTDRALPSGPPAAAGGAPAVGVPGAGAAQVAVEPGSDIADVGLLVTDAEEFADPPPPSLLSGPVIG